MKKALPILFVASTVVVTAASLTVATSGGFTQLKAADNSRTYIQTFTSSNIDSVNQPSLFTANVYMSVTTDGGASFGCLASDNNPAKFSGAYVYPNVNNHIVEVEPSDDDPGAISMTFFFKNVLSAVSVVLNGKFYEYDSYYSSDTLTYNKVVTTSDGFKISINEEELGEFYISSIDVQYTCSY